MNPNEPTTCTHTCPACRRGRRIGERLSLIVATVLVYAAVDLTRHGVRGLAVYAVIAVAVFFVLNAWGLRLIVRREIARAHDSAEN